MRTLTNDKSIPCSLFIAWDKYCGKRKDKSNIWLNHLDEKNYKGRRFSLDYVDHLGGYAVGYTAFVFAITYIIEYLD
ncbi:hypothetical protein [Prevotella sp.]|uniref:hypothetical protein n=1 Tax=Prevotella sp. TaxID=59823 RepID=UPI003DA6AE15